MILKDAKTYLVAGVLAGKYNEIVDETVQICRSKGDNKQANMNQSFRIDFLKPFLCTIGDKDYFGEVFINSTN